MPGPRRGRKICRSMRREARDQPKRTRFWRERVDAGGTSMAMKIDYVVSSARPSRFKCSAVIADVDGTLVTNEKKLTAPTQAAVAKLHASGIAFSIISSRPLRGLVCFSHPLESRCPLVVLMA